MSERGPEISAKDMGKIEIKYTVGNVEKSVEQKIQDTANKIIESGILKSEKFTTEQDRKFEADKIVESIGTGFSSYEKIVDVSRGGNYTEAQKNKAQETFDILKKSVSVAMNVGGDQELQTRLFTGGINEALPDSWNYGSDGTSKFILSEEVSKTIINNPKVRDVYREIDEIRQDYDMSDPMERKLAADEIAGKRQELLSMRKEIPKDQRDEWFLAKEYLRMKVGILDGELTSSDGSADKADVVAVLGKAVEKISVAAEKMAEATEKTTRQEVNNGNSRRNWRMVPRMDADGNVEGYESQYEPSFDGFTSGIQQMENRMTLRYNDYLSMTWYEGLSKHEKEKISLAMMMSEVANGTKKAGKDLEAIMKNDEIFGFLNEHMTTLFDKDFKLVYSKLLNDLCELYVDSNGKSCLRYKEIKDHTKVDGKVLNKLQRIHATQDEWADWLAKHKDGGNENSVASNMDKINAYTAWNMFYGFGDSSMADRLRNLPTWNGIINDGLRSLNPESKALGKWQIFKSGEAKTDQELIGFEYFTDLSNAIKRRLDLERDLKSPIDGKKFFRDKILDGEVSFLSHKMFYGFLDFFNGDRDLFKSSGEKFFDKKNNGGENVSVSKLLMDYAFKKDEDGNSVEISDSERREFTFGDDQVTFMNEFRDSLEGATMAFYCLTGKIKVDPKNAESWVKDLKSKLGMVSAMKFSDVSAFTYGRDPSFWRDILVSIYGEDDRRISSDYIALPRIETKFDKKNKLDPEEVSYNLNMLDFITNDLQLTDNYININELLRLLGVKIKKGEKPNKITIQDRLFEFSERNKKMDLYRIRNRSMKYESVRDIDSKNNQLFQELINNATRLNSNDPEFLLLRRNFNKMVDSRSYKNAFHIYEEMLKKADKN